MKKFNSVDEYIASSNYPLELQVLRDILLETALTETVKWGMPTYTYQGKNVMGIGAFKSYFGLWFHQGALLSDPAGVLINAQEGKTMALRQWRFESMGAIKPDLIQQYVKEAITNQEKGREIKPEKKPLVVPPELSRALVEHRLTDTFEGMGLTLQREYAEYISEAKKEETRLRRLEKIIPMIRGKVSLNDKYRS